MARSLEPSDLLLLSGGLGTGKTFLARAIARARGVPAGRHVTSPTFSLVQEYETASGPLVHADLYRLLDSARGLDAEVEALGLRELRERGAVCIVEWGATVSAWALGGAADLHVELEATGPHSRIARLSGPKAALIG